MNFGRLIILVFVTVFAGYVIAAPYLTVRNMRVAAESRDGETLSEYIDFPSVRQSIKDQMNAAMLTEVATNDREDNPFAALGAMLTGTIVDKAIDAYVTPAGITQLMAGESLESENNSEADSSERAPFEGAEMSYASFDKFIINIPNESGSEGKFILRRSGIQWKLTEILIPLEE